MSLLVPSKKKNDFDKFATSKSMGEALLTTGLLAGTIQELYTLGTGGEDSNKYYWATLVTLIVCLIFQITCIVLSLVLGTLRYPDETRDVDIKQATASENNGVTAKAVIAVKQTPSTYRRLNDALTILTGLLAIILVVKNTLLGAGIITIKDECEPSAIP